MRDAHLLESYRNGNDWPADSNSGGRLEAVEEAAE